MSDALTIVPLQAAHAARIETWSSQHAVNALLKLPGTSFSTAASSPHGWVVLDGDDPIAVVTIISDDEHVGHLNIMVKPNERRRGIGAELLAYALEQPEARSIRRLKALVELDNVAAQKLLTRLGFSRTSNTTDGRLEFEKH